LRTTKPKSRRKPDTSTVRVRTVALVFFAVVLAAFFGIHQYTKLAALRASSQFTSLAYNWQASLDLASNSAVPRPVFPYSVVPGGVTDARELQSAAAADPVVADHYSDFHIANARAIRLAQPVAMYVSYRRANRVYWTKHRMVIPAGETVLSDGSNLARVRCGNRLSAVKASPVAVDEPPTEKLETPDSVPPLLAQLLPGEGVDMFPGPISAIPALPNANPDGPGSPPPPPPAVFPPILPPGVPPVLFSAPPSPPPPPPVATPEPGIFALFALAAALATLVFALRRK